MIIVLCYSSCLLDSFWYSLQYTVFTGVLSESELMSSVYLLKGTVYQALDNHHFAAECFKQALKEDPYCVEAYQHLVFNHYYTGKCEDEIINVTLDSSGELLCVS